MHGILFDLDGTLVDSDPIHFEAWQKILAEKNVNEPLIDRDFFDKHISGRIRFLIINIYLYCLGRLNADITRDLYSELSKDEQEKIADKKELLFRQLAKEKLQPTKGLDKVLEYIKQNRSKLKIGNERKHLSSNSNQYLFQGLATNAPRLVVEFELGILKLDEKTFFDTALLAEEFGIGIF